MVICEVGIITCLVEDDNVKYELLSFFALMLLPLAILIRLAVDEIIFQKWKVKVITRFQRVEERVDKIEGWLKILIAAERERERKGKYR